MAPHRHRANHRPQVPRHLRRSEPLTFHGPGWTIRGADFEVTCWAPTHQQDEPASGRRDEWMLAVEIDWTRNPIDGSAMWASGSFVTGTTLIEVLPALALLDEQDRYHVTATLIHRLGDHQ